VHIRTDLANEKSEQMIVRSMSGATPLPRRRLSVSAACRQITPENPPRVQWMHASSAVCRLSKCAYIRMLSVTFDDKQRFEVLQTSHCTLPVIRRLCGL